MTQPRIVAVAAIALALAGCQKSGEPAVAPTAEESARPESAVPSSDARAKSEPREGATFAQIADDETVRFTGTEPFWGGQVTGPELTYSTPEVPDGTKIPVTRFAGNGGVSWSGTYSGARFALAVTPGECSDGMSDRTYPFVATLEVGGEQRSGCAWTEWRPFSGLANP